MGKVKIGVVGCGYLGKFHAEKYFSNPRQECNRFVYKHDHAVAFIYA